MQRIIFVIIATILVISGSMSGPARAQQTADRWVQLSAHRLLSEAEDDAARRAAALQGVAGFAIGGGWYAVVLGPFTEADAQTALRRLRAEGRIPSDSFIVRGDVLGRQFYPVDARARDAAPLAPPAPGAAAASADRPEARSEADSPQAAPASATEEEIPEETPAQARRSERALDREARAELQRALQWFGHYGGRIDAAFGPGTRRAMASWQEAAGHTPTGILTSRQRAELLAAYHAELDAIGLEHVRDETAGIEIDLPLGLVRFDRYEPPFAHYPAREGSGVSVLLISQAGDEATLMGLYDIMQTLEIVPLEGERERRRNEFVLTGRNARIISYTYARVSDGAIKGFTLIWPAGGDERRRELVLSRMRESFRPIPGAVLPDRLDEGALAQSIDLVSGLKIRRPARGRSGFFVDNRGRVLTAAEAVEGCDRVTLDETYPAAVAAIDEALGVALLEPREALAPLDFARFRLSTPRISSEIAVAGYSFEGVLPAPTLTFGRLADVRGLRGEETLQRLALAPEKGDAGGPVFDLTGSVIGLLLPPPADATRRLPAGVSFAVDSAALAEFLTRAGGWAEPGDPARSLAPEELTEIAAQVTVLVSCWMD